MARRWNVNLFERKRTPNMESKLRRLGGRYIPEDAIPQEISGFRVSGSNADQAIEAAKDHIKRLGRTLAALSVSANKKDTLIAYVFTTKG